MTMHFRYSSIRTIQPVVSLGGRGSRPRPLVPVGLVGPAATVLRDGLLDTGADDTVFPEWFAGRAGIDLTNAPVGQATGVSGAPVAVRYAPVTLRVSDGHETRTWQALVGFTAHRIRQPLLGFAGFLQYFDALFRGSREEVELTVNDLYSGT
jgi:hypothetical protein